jgi:hypothetical protein
MTVNAKITQAEYNSIRNKLANVIGTGSASSGWGQTVVSSAVGVSNLVSINDWGKLRFDIINAHKHIFGTTPTTVQPALGNTIKSDIDSVTFNGAISGTTLIAYNQSGATSMLAIGQTLTSGGGTGRSITASINNLPITITSFTSKTESSGSYLVVYAITTQPVALPFGNNTLVTISGNSNTNYNGTVPITASTTTSITVQYFSDPGTYGSGTTTVTVTPNNPWGYSTWTLSGSGTVAYSAMTAANSTTRHPITQYDDFADTIITNRFTVHSSQSGTTAAGSMATTWPGVYGADWTVRLRGTITLTWPSANAARHFFNSGGEIRFTASRTGGGVSQQNLAWNSLLNSVSAINGGAGPTFGANKPGTGVSPANGQNWYRLTSSFQEWYTLSSSTPYGSNNYKIYARTPSVANNSGGAAASAEFLIEFNDGYVDPGIASLGPGLPTQTATPADFPPGDSVDGTFRTSVSYLYATGVLEPSGTGNFTVTQPSITFGVIAPA